MKRKGKREILALPVKMPMILLLQLMRGEVHCVRIWSIFSYLKFYIWFTAMASRLSDGVYDVMIQQSLWLLSIEVCDSRGQEAGGDEHCGIAAQADL